MPSYSFVQTVLFYVYEELPRHTSGNLVLPAQPVLYLLLYNFPSKVFLLYSLILSYPRIPINIDNMIGLPSHTINFFGSESIPINNPGFEIDTLLLPLSGLRY